MRSLLLQIISPAKGRIAGVMFLSAVVSIFSIVQPALMQKLIDDGLLKEDSHTFIMWLSIMLALALGVRSFSLHSIVLRIPLFQ